VPADWVGQGKACAKKHLLFPPAAFRLCAVALRVPQRKFYNAPHLVRAIASVSVKILLRSHCDLYAVQAGHQNVEMRELSLNVFGPAPKRPAAQSNHRCISVKTTDNDDEGFGPLSFSLKEMP